jgi:gliding motility-associated-like protein
MDSITSIGCSPASLQLVFKKNIQCNSIAVDGSDFIVSGPTAVSITSAKGNCINGLTTSITVVLSAPIVTNGNYQLKLVQGRDGNTLIDECDQETPAGSTLNFITKDTVSADFSYTVFKTCKLDSILFAHDGRNGVDQWFWNLDDAGISTKQDPVAFFTNFGTKQIRLIVSNGLCSDTAMQSINLDNALKAMFETNNLLCPEDTATFINNSIGSITNYFWDFGDGSYSTTRTPAPLHYPVLSAEKIYPVRLVVENTAGCFDTAINDLKVLKSCYIAVPNAFTPNGDGLNDFLYPVNAYKADDLEFSIYNRLGQKVFYTKDWTKKWDGTINGEPQDSGVYVWILKYTNRDTGLKVFQKGSTVLIR